MAKVKNPLLSFGARGLVGTISYLKRRGLHLAEKTPVLKDAKSPAQLSWRTMYLMAVDLWHALSAAEKVAWESAARPKHMTGFAWFVSQALKPNPGIYLPLLGGTMQGNIDMATFKIENLPDPTAAQEPLTLAYYTANIQPYLYNEGARVFHTSAQTIPNATETTLAFNGEQYDTDTIHDTITNNSRLTCKTAGKYIIVAHAGFVSNNVGRRHMYFLRNATQAICQHSWGTTQDSLTRMNDVTIYSLNVNDYIELLVYQNSGAPLNIAHSPYYSAYFMMQRIG